MPSEQDGKQRREDRALPTRGCPWRSGKNICSNIINAVIPAKLVPLAVNLTESEAFPFGARCEAGHSVLLYVDKNFDVREVRCYLPIGDKDGDSGADRLRKWVSEM